MFKLKLHWQILIALVLGAAIGTVLQATQGEEVKNNGFVSFMEFMGSTVFIGLLKMVIVPLIFSSIVAVLGLSPLEYAHFDNANINADLFVYLHK